MYQNILIALEGKVTDEAALNHAMNLARETSASVTLFQVIVVAADSPGGFGLQLQLELGSSGWRRRNKAEETLAKLEARLRLNGINVQTVLLVSDRGEADEIVDFADQHGYDLIVMAADGRPLWQRTLFGCPVDGVQRKASVPTLFVSDGTRRERVAIREEVSTNQIMTVFGGANL
jgi:nucleotide-binding universal stress UspA family protein